MIVDDDRENIMLLRTMINEKNFEFFVAFDGKDALEKLSVTIPDIILLDVKMPEMDGFETCKKIKSNPSTKEIPVIFLSATATIEDKIKGFEAGADDFISKPFYSVEVKARINLHLQKRHQMRHLKQLLKRSYHELYNPLSIINTSAQLYNFSYPKNDYVDSMHAAAKSLYVIYQDLYFAINPKEKINCIETIDMKEFLGDRMEYFTLIAQIKENTFNFSSDGNFNLHIDKNALERIVDNTLSNAIKYSDEKSVIEVTISVKPRPSITITNYGKEIQNPEKIFTEGYRESYEYHGMGIGLDIVSSLCHSYQINAEVHSENSKTSFIYTFMPDQIEEIP